jgi:hypothetical protein
MRTVKIVVLITALAIIAPAQQVTVDWPTKKITSQPTSVEKQTNATVRVDNVNDLMYTYSVSYSLKPLTISDFDTIGKAFGIATKAAAGEAAPCDFAAVLTAEKAFTDAEASFMNLPSTNTGCSASKPCSISLDAAKAAWQKNVQPTVVASRAAIAGFQQLCTSQTYAQAIKAASDALDAAEEKVAGSHSITKENGIVLSPENTTSLAVDEVWMGTPTVNGTYSVDLQPSNHRLTLSAGALFSEVQNRSYASTAAPNASGTGTTNILTVNGISTFNPSAVALLNYEIPQADWERVGFAVSTGPVFRLGSSSNTTSQ